MQGRIGVDYSHEHHIWEIKSFGDHLRANEEIDLMFTKGRQRSLMAPTRPHRIGVHPRHANPSKLGPHLILQPLCPSATMNQIASTTFGTRGWQLAD
jgi:hypothetical protein